MTRLLSISMVLLLVTGAGCHKMVEVSDDAGERDTGSPPREESDTGGAPLCEEGDSCCNEEMLQLCVGGEWRDYSDCEIQDRECTMVDGAATCVPRPEETETGSDTVIEKETETDMGPASVVFCNTDTMDGASFEVRMSLTGDSRETVFEATSYCCTECTEVDSGEQVHYEIYYQEGIQSYGDIALEGGREYIIVTLPDPLDPMIGILDLTKIEEDCATYIPSQHTRCKEGTDTGTEGTDTDSEKGAKSDAGVDAGRTTPR